MNSGPMGGGGGGGGFRRDDGGRGKRGGDNRRQGNQFMDNAWKTQRTTTFPVDTSKLKAVTQKVWTKTCQNLTDFQILFSCTGLSACSDNFVACACYDSLRLNFSTKNTRASF